MQVWAEVRWFHLGAVPEDLITWFCQPALDFHHRVSGGRQRKDVYLLFPETELSIKSRGGKKGLEVKGFLDVVVLAAPLQASLRVAAAVLQME